MKTMAQIIETHKETIQKHFNAMRDEAYEKAQRISILVERKLSGGLFESTPGGKITVRIKLDSDMCDERVSAVLNEWGFINSFSEFQNSTTSGWEPDMLEISYNVIDTALVVTGGV